MMRVLLSGNPSKNLFRGALIILCGAFVWGVGNAVTGLTAQKYLHSGSLFPAVDIALANTIGGLLFLVVTLLVNIVATRTSSIKDDNQISARSWTRYLKRQSLLSGVLKGANTCFFVFSATYVAATKSLIFESTYIVWSLFLAIFFLTRRIPLLRTLSKTFLLVLGVFLVSGQINLDLNGEHSILGLIFGICAGLSYALFLFFWSFVTVNFSDLKSQIIATSTLLIISSLTIMILTEILSAVLLKTWWIPFANLKLADIILQVINGIFVVGVTYLLLTIGLTYLKNVREGANLIAALGLSFSIPFTLLPELIFGKFFPTILQIIGIFLFMVGFVLMSINLNSQRDANG